MILTNIKANKCTVLAGYQFVIILQLIKLNIKYNFLNIIVIYI